MQWYEKWFNKYYIQLYEHRDLVDALHQVKLILKTFSIPKDKAILDLACGDGRYTHLFQKEGFCIRGIDLSAELIQLGREKYPDIDISVEDMKVFTGSYDYIFSLFSSFGYFSDGENRDLIQLISSRVHSRGGFWLDYLNPSHLKGSLQSYSKKEINGIVFHEHRSLEPHYVVKKISIEEKGQHFQFEEKVRLYESSDILSLAESSGLKIKNIFGDYFGNPLKKDSPRAIFAFEK